MRRTLITFLVLLLITLILTSFVLIYEPFKHDINTATAEELSALDEIGQVTAERIVEYASFQHIDSMEQLDNIPYIGEKRIKELKKYFKAR